MQSGEPIPDERLEAVPTAELTVEEQERSVHRIPATIAHDLPSAHAPSLGPGLGMRLPNSAHESRPWRIREIAPDFILEDVWALPTPGRRR